MDITQGKIYYKPEGDKYLATLIDLIEKPKVATPNGPKDKIRMVWTITTLAGQPVFDLQGNPTPEATAYVTASISEKSSQPMFRNLYKILHGILGAPPPLVTKFEQLEALVLGRSNVLMLTKEPKPGTTDEFYSNIVGIMPFPAGLPVPQAPANFQRNKFRQNGVTINPQGQTVATYATPQAAAAAAPQYQAPQAPVAAPAAAPVAVPTAEQIAAFLAAQAGQKNVGF